MATFFRNFVRPRTIRCIFMHKDYFHRILPVKYLHNSKTLFDALGQEIKMPSLSPTMTEGTIIRWLKKEGDSISPGDVLCEIQTDKAVVGFEVEEEGVLAKIFVPDDTKDVKIGTIIGLMVDPGEDWQNVKAPTSSASEPVEKAEDKGKLSGIEIKMPSLSPTMTEGTIVKWLKKEGESFSPGDALCEIQTDKAVVAFEIEEEGVLAKILVPEDTKNVQLGTVIAIMVMEGEDWRNVTIPAQSQPPEPSVLISTHTTLPPSTAIEMPQKLCGPSVRNLLQEYGIKYELVTATGPHDVLLKSDVLQYINSNKLKPQPHIELQSPSQTPDITFVESDNYTDLPLTSMRKTIAKRLTESKTTIPHAYMSIECPMSEVMKLRSIMKRENITVSLNDFIIKCAAHALVRVPEVNVVKLNNEVKKSASVDISVAVATEKGLITPIVKQANYLGVQQISEQVKALATKARAGRLKPEEYQGGSFSISNLGMYGISEFVAVINPPQGAILAVGTSRLTASDDKPSTKVTVTLSYDASMIDATCAARFLQCFKEYLENPFAMVVNLPEAKINDLNS